MAQPPHSKPSLPALDRGLSILDYLIRAGGGPVRYGELRNSLKDVQDSSLARILKALESYGYIERDADTGYRITTSVLAWGAYLREDTRGFEDLARLEIDRLTREGQESACITLLQGDRIQAICSRSVEGGISILKTGYTLHFEPDHAGAIVVLEKLSPVRRQAFLGGPFSGFRAGQEFAHAYANMETIGHALIDRSLKRPGVSRIAQSFKHGGSVGCVFFCLTEAARPRKQAQLASLLDGTCRRLQAD